jgi:hypothetical protein
MYIPSNPGVPNLGDASPWGDARDLKSVMSWVHLYQWGDADTKRLGTPGLNNINLIHKEFALQDKLIIIFNKTKIL